MVIAVSRFLLPVDHVRRGGGARARRVVQPHSRHRPRAGAAVQELRRLLLALLLRLEHLLSESVMDGSVEIIARSPRLLRMSHDS